jgi:hypothetical protein
MNSSICACTRSSCFPALSSARCRSAASWVNSCCVVFAVIEAWGDSYRSAARVGSYHAIERKHKGKRVGIVRPRGPPGGGKEDTRGPGGPLASLS